MSDYGDYSYGNYYSYGDESVFVTPEQSNSNDVGNYETVTSTAYSYGDETVNVTPEYSDPTQEYVATTPEHYVPGDESVDVTPEGTLPKTPTRTTSSPTAGHGSGASSGGSGGAGQPKQQPQKPVVVQIRNLIPGSSTQQGYGAAQAGMSNWLLIAGAGILAFMLGKSKD